jgi:WD40 repeat protein
VLHANDGYHNANARLEFSPDNRWLMRASVNRIALWDTTSADLIEKQILPGLSDAWIWDARTLLTFGADGVQLWTNAGPVGASKLGLSATTITPSKDLAGCFPAPARDQILICRGADGSLFGAPGADPSGPVPSQGAETAPVFPLTKPRLHLPGLFQQGQIEFHPNGQWIASGSWNNAGDFGPGMSIWSAITGQRLQRIPIGNSSPYFSPDGRWFLAAGTMEYRLFEVRGNPEQWLEVRRIPRQSYALVAGNAAFAAHKPWLAVQADEQEIQILDLPSGQELARLPSPWPQVSRMAWSPDGRWLASDSRMGTRLWDLHLLRTRLRELGLDWD